MQTFGAEAEVRRDWRNGVTFSASYSFQHSAYQNNDNHALREVPNSPQHLASVKAAAPILGSALGAMTRVSIQGPPLRQVRLGERPAAGDDAGRRALGHRALGRAASLRHPLLARALQRDGLPVHAVPVEAREFTQTSIVQNGRTVMATTQVSF